MTIKLLDHSVIEKISAGEVVENPASIVKELVENSIDAGADTIDIAIVDGGKKSIKISDNGCGMNLSDAKKSILRHATSKILKYEDLSHITSMGFRGEALASVAAVSRLEIITKESSAVAAEHLYIEENNIINVEKSAALDGTTIIVSDLFYNVPVRKKFLKSNSSEYSSINSIIEKMAISYPNISFSFRSNDKLVFQTAGNGNLIDVVSRFFGAGFGSNVYELECLENNILIKGLIGAEQFTWHNRTRQVFFVNKRYIQNKILSNALMIAYKKFFHSPNKFPQAIIFIEIDPELIDVNIHPQKNEIKFANEDQMFDALYRAITKKISKPLLNELDGVLSYTTNDQNKELNYKEENNNEKSYIFAESRYNNYQKDSSISPQITISDFKTREDEFKIGEINIGNIEILGTYLNTYILCKDNNSILIFDQHAAHERILYEHFINERRFDTQILLIPVLLKLNITFNIDMQDLQSFFLNHGFSISYLGGYDWSVTGVPDFLYGMDIESFFNEILEMQRTYKKTDFIEKIIAKAACKASVKSGQNLSNIEIKELMSNLAKTENPSICPHGRPTYIILAKNDLEKMFKR